MVSVTLRALLLLHIIDAAQVKFSEGSSFYTSNPVCGLAFLKRFIDVPRQQEELCEPLRPGPNGPPTVTCREASESLSH